MIVCKLAKMDYKLANIVCKLVMMLCKLAKMDCKLANIVCKLAKMHNEMNFLRSKLYLLGIFELV